MLTTLCSQDPFEFLSMMPLGATDGPAAECLLYMGVLVAGSRCLLSTRCFVHTPAILAGILPTALRAPAVACGV